MKKRGISLVSLLITAIVLIILSAAIWLAIPGEHNPITMATKASWKQRAKTYQEETIKFLMEARVKATEEEVEYIHERINAAIPDEEVAMSYYDLKEIISSLLETDREDFAVYHGQLYFVRNTENKERFKWAREIGIKIWGEEELPKSAVIEDEDGSYQSPDLSGFDPENTYYLSYNRAGKEERICAKEDDPPENWYSYNYRIKRWANIVVKNPTTGDEVYLVWIPRYVYKITGDSIDVKFVTKNNVYIDNKGIEHSYESLLLNGYVLHSSFDIDMSDEGKENIKLAGYWMSKYELSQYNVTDFTTREFYNRIEIHQVTSTPSHKEYKYYIDGQYKGQNRTGVFAFENLTPSTEYEITVEGIEASGGVYDRITKRISTIGEADRAQPNPPDISSFQRGTVYYITYDLAGNEVRKLITKPVLPEDWYNYSQKAWANILVKNTVTGDEVYMVWVPKFEYRVQSSSMNPSDHYVDINFIGKDVIEATDGYIIPNVFTVDMSDEGKDNIRLSGYWMSKYPISQSELTNVVTKEFDDRIEIHQVTSTCMTKRYRYYINNRLEGENDTGVFTFENLTPSKEYAIKVEGLTASGGVYGKIEKRLSTIAIVEPNEPNPPEVSSFSNFYYLTFDASGNEIRSTTQPENWYNYENKQWANIVVRNEENGEEAYLVWIPKYEYRIQSTGVSTANYYSDIRFVGKDVVEPDDGYIIPNVFTVDMSDEEGKDNVRLSGYWISKYELVKFDITNFATQTYDTSIQIYQVTTTCLKKNFKYYLNGEFKGQNTTGVFTFEDLTPSTEYVVKVEGLTLDGGLYDSMEKTLSTVGVATKNEPNAPDVSNLSNFYYLTYDGSGNEVRSTTQPENWYNYENKQWANIVIKNNETDDEVYLVWIPKYEYRVITASTTLRENYIDINFVGKDVIEATDGYIIPNVFTVDMSDEPGKSNIQLAGYWMSKYEVAEFDLLEFYSQQFDRSIRINQITTTSTKKNFKYYLNGEFKGQNTTGVFVFENLTPSTDYVVKVEGVTDNNRVYDTIEKTLSTVGTAVQNEPNPPNLSNFNTFYYLTFDASGNEIRSTTQPENWYNYDNKQWANIVVKNNVTGDEAYLVWIPRYEYRVVNASATQSENYVEINFIPKTKIEATDGYIIPNVFTLDMSDDYDYQTGLSQLNNVNLDGYWICKYELSLFYITDIQTEELANSISILSVSTTCSTKKYKYYIDNLYKGENTTGSFEFTGLNPNTSYEIKVVGINENGGAYDAETRMVQTIPAVTDSEPNPPNVSNFSNFYYLTYDGSGNEVRSTSEPENWYDYSNKQWANIVVKNEESGDEVYLVWIPKYEYRITRTGVKVDIHFISRTQVEPSDSYIIPDVFTVDMSDERNLITGRGPSNILLDGYWISKYEISGGR